jgi:hypothetical protein
VTRAAVILASLAACNLGIGSDPSAARSACAPGHARLSASSGCFVPQVPITIDGDIADWAGVPAIAVAPACLAPPCDGLTPVAVYIAAGSDDATPDLFVRASFGGAPPMSDPDLRAVMQLAASTVRPATAGSDQLIAGASGEAFAKNGYAIARVTPYRFAWTADGFEAAIDGQWPTFQGAGEVTVTVERASGSAWIDVAPMPPLAACWGYRSGSDALPGSACEAVPK